MPLHQICAGWTLSLMLLGGVATPFAAAPRDVSHSTDAALRLDYLGKLLDSRSGQRLAQHPDGAIRGRIEAMLAQAREAIAGGDNDTADALTKQALETLMSAVRELPADPEETARHKARYEELRRGLEKFNYAQAANRERFAAQAKQASEPDHSQVNKLLALADRDAKAGDYEQAVTRLTEAQSIVTSALRGMLNHKQLVIELDIGTPEKEYFYELRRYQGYEELIPVAIETKRPNEMATQTMIKLGEKAKWMSEQARGKAMQGDYAVAIRMIMDATDVVKQALRVVGITM
ncbi:hypothetical protein Tel_14290 [Candidatus Tenderia electrophaga]|uniref:PpiC domain-containing protein n=1 Tax=Candidatus Tenderia electrophaga TaxID=1748243 RepID=A0A0S2TGE9_9GAMM|nr:hypothetical protein Tel_14290 [Candidatus Tenderia electrophaga]